jgi:hypothetical protein
MLVAYCSRRLLKKPQAFTAKPEIAKNLIAIG